MSWTCPEKHKNIAVAFAHGKHIQFFHEDEGRWRDCQAAPTFSPASCYRVKPERRWKWVYERKDGSLNITTHYHTHKEIHFRCGKHGSKVVTQLGDYWVEDE